MPTGTILVHEEQQSTRASEKVALYASVSSSDQKPDLERQIGRLTNYATQNGLNIDQAVSEIGSGLNGHRPKLLKLLSDPNIAAIVVEHKDRLARFGVEHIEACLQASGRSLIVVDSSEMNDDLTQDMIDVLTSFCARLYGRRSARNRAKKALRATESDE